MTTLMGHWEEVVAQFRDETDDLSHPGVISLLEVAGVAFNAGANALLERVEQGATLQELLEEFGEVSKAIENMLANRRRGT